MAAPAHAAFYTFTKLTNNGNVDVASQLLVEVIDGMDGTVTFKFTNDVGIASSITDVYFDDGTLLAIAQITSSSGVDFTSPATPGNLSGANLASPPFVTTQNFSADSTPPASQNGVDDDDEWLKIKFTLQDASPGVPQTYADTIAALNSGALRIGLHVQAIGTTGGSDSYVNAVPDGGATIALLGMALTGMGVFARRKK
jgi:hypothetical protein